MGKKKKAHLKEVYTKVVVDTQTYQEYTIKSLAKELVMFRSELIRLLENPPTGFKYILKDYSND